MIFDNLYLDKKSSAGNVRLTPITAIAISGGSSAIKCRENSGTTDMSMYVVTNIQATRGITRQSRRSMAEINPTNAAITSGRFESKNVCNIYMLGA